MSYNGGMEAQTRRIPKPPKQRSGKPARASRIPDEDIPRSDYCDHLRQIGPRPGESALAFAKRMAMLIGTRIYWLDVWRRVGGNRVDAARLAGIPASNVANELKQVGLNSALLNDALLGKVELT